MEKTRENSTAWKWSCEMNSSLKDTYDIFGVDGVKSWNKALSARNEKLKEVTTTQRGKKAPNFQAGTRRKKKKGNERTVSTENLNIVFCTRRFVYAVF